ncbi:MAG TPA: PH domain-containing protein, partial [Solirubrobacteraceae bacterium]
RELLVAAATAGQLGVILPVLAAATQLVDDVYVNDDPRRVAGGLVLLPDTAGEIALAALALLAVAWIVSMAGAIVAFAGFSVTRTGDRLVIRRGLLARREASVPLARIQAVIVIEGLLRQPFGLASLRVEVAGYAREAAAAQTLFPLVRAREVEAFLAEMAPALAGDPAPLARPPGRALRRYALPPTLIAAVPALAAALVLGSLWPLLAVLPAALLGPARFRAAGWRIEPARVTIRSRRLAQRTVLARRTRLQEHRLSQTPFQRRGRLATLALAAGAGTRARVAHLEEPVARELFAAL